MKTARNFALYFVSDNLKKQEKNPKRNRNSSIATILKDYVRKAQYSMGQSLYTSTLTAIIKEKKNEDLCLIIKKNYSEIELAMYTLSFHVQSANKLKGQDNDISITNRQ